MHYGALLVGDQFALGAPDPARIYAQTASRSDELSRFEMLKFHKALTGHVSHAQVCWLHGIEMRKVPVRFGKLQEAEPLSAAAIRAALAADSAGRDNHIDRQLVAPRAPLSLQDVSAFPFFLLARALHYSSRPTGRGRAPSPSPHRARARLGIYDS